MADRGDSPYVGVVKSFNPQKGWGFIECDETFAAYGKDILFTKAELQGDTVDRGDTIEFSVTTGRNGPLAVDLRFLDRASDGMPALDEYVGSIKSYSDAKGWGFVECPETFAIHQKDILFQKSALMGGFAAPGDRVVFSVTEGRNGPLATGLRMLDAPPRAPPGRASPEGWGVTMAGGGCGGSAEGQGAYHGCIKSFNAAKGWGFIASEEAHRQYGKDIMVLKSALPGGAAEPGQQVTFSIVAGRHGPLAEALAFEAPLAAKRRRPLSASPAPPAEPAQPWRRPIGAMPFVSAVARRPSTPIAAFVTAPQAPQAPTAGLCGVVKSFDEATGWGFVAGDAILAIFGKDVYMSAAALHGQRPRPGSQVFFTYSRGLKGPMVDAATLLPDGSFSVAGQPAAVYTGHVKSYNETKGWGFVTSNATEQLFGKELFLHKRELSGDSAQAGEQVTYSVQLNREARPEAARVVPLGSSGAMRAQPSRAARRASPY